jgi:hypothetical protein
VSQDGPIVLVCATYFGPFKGFYKALVPFQHHLVDLIFGCHFALLMR